MSTRERPPDILLVDDDEFSLEFVGDVLHSIGSFNIRMATDARRALVEIQTRAPDILICDLNMPGMDGIELLRHAASRNFEGAVILLSGMDKKLLQAAENLAEAHRLNLLGALTKPVSEADLVAILERLDTEATYKRSQVECELITPDELTEGLASNRLLLFVQPKVSLKDRQVTGVECLARWLHPTRGILTPDAFIGLAEQFGMIDALTCVILRMSAIQLKAWQSAGHAVRIAVNVSMDSLHDLELPEIFGDIVARAGVSPADVTLEITESRLMTNHAISLDILTRLRLKGFELSIDDFGTGYSTLEKLKHLPFNELKIDREFVYGATHDESARTILESSARLGRGLHLKVVAEGIETAEEWALTLRAGCSEAQGYYVARPMPANDFTGWLRTWSRTNPPGETAMADSSACLSSSGQIAHLLIVDDDPFMHDLYKETLATRFRITTASSGKETLTLLESEKPDLIILDIDMPRMDGYETCRRLRQKENCASIPVIFVSSYNLIEDRLAGYDAGGQDYVLKPFDGKEIEAKIIHLIQRESERSQLKEMADFAGRTAMTAMSSLGEMGVLIQSLQRFNACTDYKQLALAVLDGIGQYGLQGAVRIKTDDEPVVFNSKGENNPLETSIIDHMSGMDRIVQFKSRMSISFDHVAALVVNMPEADAEFCGRLRDHLATLIEGANVRAETITATIRSERQGIAIERTIAKIIKTLAEIDDAQRRSRVATNLAIQKLNDTVEKTLLKMALTEAHEAMMANVVADGVETILAAQSMETDLQDRFTGIVEELKRLARTNR